MTTFLKELGSAITIRKNFKPVLLKIQEVRAKSKRILFGLNEIEPDCPQNKKVFIIHGGKEDDYKLRLCMKFLRDTLNLEPVVQKPFKNRFFSNTLFSYNNLAKDCSAVIVIFSHDIETQTVKQNILVEVGYFFGKFHKEKERKIIILNKLYTSIPSDFYSIPRISYQRSIKETFSQLKSQFKYWNFLDSGIFIQS